MAQNRTKSRNYTMFGKNDKVIHLPIEPAFCPVTRSILIETAKSLGIHVHQTGTAVVIEGPRFSTKAESNVYRSWNADLVNMTLAPEVSSRFDMYIVPLNVTISISGRVGQRSGFVVRHGGHGHRLRLLERSNRKSQCRMRHQSVSRKCKKDHPTIY